MLRKTSGRASLKMACPNGDEKNKLFAKQMKNLYISSRRKLYNLYRTMKHMIHCGLLLFSVVCSETLMSSSLELDVSSLLV